LPVVITAYADKSFTFIIKTPPTSVLIRKAVKVEKGSAKPNSDKVGRLTRAQVEQIAKQKMPDLTAADLDAAMRSVAGSARSMGVEGLAELHDVQAALAQCRADRRARIGFACRNLQLDEADDFFCHDKTPLESGC